jgi:hypothetical protein
MLEARARSEPVPNSMVGMGVPSRPRRPTELGTAARLKQAEYEWPGSDKGQTQPVRALPTLPQPPLYPGHKQGSGDIFDRLASRHMTTPNQKLYSDRGARSCAATVKARKKKADARAAEPAPIVAALWAAGITSWDCVAKALNARGVPATGRGIWEPREVRRVMERLK